MEYVATWHVEGGNAENCNAFAPYNQVNLTNEWPYEWYIVPHCATCAPHLHHPGMPRHETLDPTQGLPVTNPEFYDQVNRTNVPPRNLGPGGDASHLSREQKAAAQQAAAQNLPQPQAPDARCDYCTTFKRICTFSNPGYRCDTCQKGSTKCFVNGLEFPSFKPDKRKRGHRNEPPRPVNPYGRCDSCSNDKCDVSFAAGCQACNTGHKTCYLRGVPIKTPRSRTLGLSVAAAHSSDGMHLPCLPCIGKGRACEWPSNQNPMCRLCTDSKAPNKPPCVIYQPPVGLPAPPSAITAGPANTQQPAPIHPQASNISSGTPAILQTSTVQPAPRNILSQHARESSAQSDDGSNQSGTSESHETGHASKKKKPTSSTGGMAPLAKKPPPPPPPAPPAQPRGQAPQSGPKRHTSGQQDSGRSGGQGAGGTDQGSYHTAASQMAAMKIAPTEPTTNKLPSSKPGNPGIGTVNPRLQTKAPPNVNGGGTIGSGTNLGSRAKKASSVANKATTTASAPKMPAARPPTPMPPAAKPPTAKHVKANTGTVNPAQKPQGNTSTKGVYSGLKRRP